MRKVVRFGVHGVALDDHVRRLDVAVDEAAGVHRVQPVGDLGDQGRGLIGCQWPIGRDQPAEVATLHVAHRDIQKSLALSGAKDRDHPRMLDGGGSERLGAEAGAEALLSGELGPDHLERDQAVKS